MTSRSTYLQHLLNRPVKQVAARVAEIIQDSRSMKTEVIRDGGFVHGSMYPAPKAPRRNLTGTHSHESMFTTGGFYAWLDNS
jgi:hypothetical protein